ncbi:MAG: MBL fold metallo-hydrolase [Sciscionella sp.]
MQIVHYGHSCVLLDTGSARLLIDPGCFSSGFEALNDLDVVLITHQHADHVDTGKLVALLAGNPRATLVTDSGTRAAIAELDTDSRTVQPGDVLEFGSSVVHVVGGQHAIIHPDIPVVRNCGYLIDHGAFYHPGDSLFIPEQRVDVLGLPTGAPWLKSSEAVDFLRAVKPRVAVPIHQAVLATPEIWYGQFSNLAPKGATVEVLPQGEPAQL